MKDKNTIIIIDIVLIMIAVALGIFLVVVRSDSKAQNVEENALEYVVEQVNVNIDESLMSEFVNEKLGFKLKKYNEFTRKSEVTDESAVYKSAAMYREEGNEGINVLVTAVEEGSTLENYIYANVEAVKNDLPEGAEVIVIKEGVKLGGVDAFKIRYKADTLNIYQIITIKDNKEYIVTYSGEDKYYDKQKGENMFATFEFI